MRTQGVMTVASRSLTVIAISLLGVVAVGCSTTNETGEAVSTTTTSNPVAAQPATTTTAALSSTTAATTETAIDPAAFGQELVDVATAPGGLVYVSAPVGVASMDDSEEWTLIDVTELPEGAGLEDGWPGRMVDHVATGPEGTLWIAGHATSHGDYEQFGGVIDEWSGGRFLTWIARHDCGSSSCSWTVFTTNDVPDLNGDIGDLAVAHDGTVFASVGDNRLLVFDGTAWDSHTLSDLPTGWSGGVSPWSSSLAIATDGVLWAGTNAPGEGRGLFAFDGTGFTRYTTDNGLPDDQTFVITAAPDGTIWAATDALYEDPSTASPEAAAGIAAFDGTTWTSYTIADGLLSNDAIVTTGPDGSVWAVHSEIPPYGYARFNSTDWTAYPFESPTYGFRVAVDADGTVWMAARQGLVGFDGTTQTVYPSPFTN